MSWTLHSKPVNHDRADDMLSTLGRATYVAQNFEQKLRFLYQAIEISDLYVSGVPFDEIIEKVRDENRLNRVIQSVAQKAQLAENPKNILDASRKARNWIAHESGKFPIHGTPTLINPVTGERGSLLKPFLSDDSPYLKKQLVLLRINLWNLAAGDYLVSYWAHMTEELEQIPPAFAEQDYKGAVDRWVFAHVWDLVGSHEEDPWPGGRVMEHDGQVLMHPGFYPKPYGTGERLRKSSSPS